MKKANFDTTYCVRICDKPCWRHADNYDFDKKEEYWFTNECIKYNIRNKQRRVNKS